MNVKIALAALALVALVGAAPAAATPRVVVHIASRVGDRGPASDRAKRARADQAVTLFAVLEITDGSKTRLYSDAQAVVLRGRRRRARPLSEAPPVLWIWEKVEPAVESLSNTEGGRFHFAAIDYGEAVVPLWLGRSRVRADVRPTLTTDRGDGVGTMRYRLVAVTGAGFVATPGPEARRGRGSGGLSDRVHRVTIRRDDSYVGLLTELYGQPYIWASAGKTARTHQTERLEGSDCADFVVYGRRRLGERIPYTWTGSLPEYTRLLGRGSADAEGVYRDRRGRPIAFPKVGDLVLFPRHVGVLTEDRGVPGVLDLEDVMMHSYFASPREQAIGESDYAASALEVRRWK